MCDTHHDLHGDPEAMRRFAERTAALSLPGVTSGPSVCAGGLPGCATFTAADLASTTTLASVLAETGEALATLRQAALVAAEDYLATDRAGTQAIGVATAVVIVEAS
ncbi:hypothetical protein ACFS2C_10420 [Prauserella oleivorans]|uniref:ESX-1 secretion-associated protein n=1 Tax=Prauserella oleivorans TaxID=1478153 RepID=A0ABW5W989_9PSEU